MAKGQTGTCFIKLFILGQYILKAFHKKPIICLGMALAPMLDFLSVIGRLLSHGELPFFPALKYRLHFNCLAIFLRCNYHPFSALL